MPLTSEIVLLWHPLASFLFPPPSKVAQLTVDLSYDHIYYLEKRECVAPPPPAVPTLGPHGWVYPPQPPPPVPRIVGRTTALRLKSGEFVPHRIGFMKRTQAYAKQNNVPVDNLVTFSVSSSLQGLTCSLYLFCVDVIRSLQSSIVISWVLFSEGSRYHMEIICFTSATFE